MILTIIKVVRVIVQAVKSEYYLSTRISNNESKGWTMDENIKLGTVRKKSIGCSVVNPCEFYVKGWTNVEYMILWRVVVKLMAMLGKTMISYDEDVSGSEGCKEERELAYTLGMTVITK